MEKRIALWSAILLAGLVFSSCRKPQLNTPPTADTDVKTTVDATFATQIVSDIEMIASCAVEDGVLLGKLYGGIPVRTNNPHRVTINFNHTLCNDGKVRDGAIFIFFQEPAYAAHPITGNEIYTRDYNFTGRITLEEYKVDGWLVDNKDYENPNNATNNTTVLLRNTRPDNNTPVAGKLQWTISGGFTIRKDADSLAWKGSLTKTLENTADAQVFDPSATQAIQWPLALVSYKGDAKGYTHDRVPFSIKYYDKMPIQRDFTCNPYGNSATPSQLHPIVAGVASFTTGTAYPREIYYDNTQISYGAAENPVNLRGQCDNKAAVQIKGIFYPVDLKN